MWRIMRTHRFSLLFVTADLYFDLCEKEGLCLIFKTIGAGFTLALQNRRFELTKVVKLHS